MSGARDLHWTSWPAELGAIRAPSATGNHYVARPAGGRFALYLGGVPLDDYPTRAEARRAAQRMENLRTTKGPTR